MTASTILVFLTLGRILTGAIFMIAALAKLRARPGQFLNAILGYDALPKAFAVALARGLPWLELAVGGLLILGLWSQPVAVIGAGMSFMFSCAIAYSLLRGKEHPCGCFDTVTPIQWKLVYRDLVLMGLLFLIYASGTGGFSVDGWLSSKPNSEFQFLPSLPAIVSIWLCSIIAAVALNLFTRRKRQAIRKTVQPG